MHNQSYLDTFIVLIFLLLCLAIGVYKTTKIKTIKEFALGYNNISITVLVCIIFASYAGAGSTIGVTSKIYDFGAIYVISQMLMPLSWFITTIVIAQNIGQFKGCISFGEIMYKLYGAPGRWITALVSTIRSLGSIAAQALAMGLLFNYFLGIDTNYGVLIGYSIITIYAAFGGIKAVIHTEIFKFSVFFLIIPISYIVVFSKAGGIENFTNALPATHINIDLSKENIALLSSFAFYYLLPAFSPDFIQKFLIAKDTFQLKKALTMITLIALPFSGAFCLIAYNMKALYPNINPNEALLFFVAILPPILKGLMIAGLIAIIMSMAEAKINSTSVILVNDVLKVLYPNLSDIKQLILLRLATVTLSVSSLVIINLSDNILDLVWMVANFWDPIIVIPASAGFLGFKTNSKSFITSVIMAMLFTITGRFVTGEFAIMSVGLGVIGSAIGLFGAHYWQVKTGLIQLVDKSKKSFNLHFWLSQKLLKLAKQPLHFILYVLNILNIKEEHHKLKIREFCTFTLSYYFIFSLHVTSGPGQVVFAYLISTGYALCLLFLFREFVFTKRFINKYLHLYWHFLLTFCLPFVSSYILLAGKGDLFWVISSIFSALMLYIFTDSKRFLILYSIGLVMAYALLRYTHNTYSLDGISNISSASYIYLSFMFITLFLFRKSEAQVKAKTVHDKIAMMEVFGGAMAHEVKSPLATMAMYTQHIQVLASKIAKENYTQEHNQLLEETKILNGVAMQGIKTVENLLMSMKKSVVTEDKKVCIIEDCINAALEEYELLNYPRDIVSVKIVNNFKFYGSPTYMKHVLLNLLSNAYKYGGRNIEIKITAKGNKLHFRDNGRGIPKESLRRIFEKFYTSSVSGTGIGLPFCKMVMEDMGGDIECKSEVGKYTHFTLHFPKVKRNKLYYINTK